MSKQLTLDSFDVELLNTEIEQLFGTLRSSSYRNKTKNLCMGDIV